MTFSLIRDKTLTTMNELAIKDNYEGVETFSLINEVSGAEYQVNIKFSKAIGNFYLTLTNKQSLESQKDHPNFNTDIDIFEQYFIRLLKDSSLPQHDHEGFVGAVSLETLSITSKKQVKYPIDATAWIKCASMAVSDKNPALTLILDLDDTMILLNQTIVPFTQVHPLTFLDYSINKEYDAYFAPTHFYQARTVQNNGHKIKVFTSGYYTFKPVQALFARNGIYLSEGNYFNRQKMEQAISGYAISIKKSFIESNDEFDHSYLLVDDTIENKPANVHFYHCNAYQNRFPSFEQLTELPGLTESDEEDEDIYAGIN